MSTQPDDDDLEAREPLELPQRDARSIARIRGQIIDYRLNGQTLATLVDAIERAIAAGSARLRQAQDAIEDPLIFLEAVVASGGDHSAAVDKALEEIDGALRRVLEQHAA
jgi:hypothetical protein